MATTPWMFSDDIIEAVTRKISIPLYQTTVTPEDILKHANEEMFISQVPSMLQYHEEYLVTTLNVPLVDNKTRYSVPDRAIGMKLRDIFYQDSNNNLFEMTRISPDDRAFFGRTSNGDNSLHKFYVEGNDIVLAPSLSSPVSGSLLFVYFLRPNQLVRNERAAFISAFAKNLTIDNSLIVAGDTFTLDSTVFQAVASSPTGNQFLIDANSIATATNLTNVINNSTVASANNGSPSSAIVTVSYSNRNSTLTSTGTGITISNFLSIEFTTLPTIFEDGSIVDFLQTKPGHKTKGMSVPIDLVSATSLLGFNPDNVPTDLVIGDYMCLENECVIPQIPPDLHNALAERVCARVLASLGDQAGLDMVNQKLQEIETRQGNLLDNRIEGAPQKLLNNHSLLRYNSSRFRRGF